MERIFYSEKYETCSVEFIADQLCNQKSVAVFNGLAEAGLEHLEIDPFCLIAQ